MDMDGPESTFNPLSIANISSSVIVVVGLILLGIMTYLIAKNASDTKTQRTKEWHSTMNSYYSFAYVGVLSIVIGFGMGYVFD